jgi:hypothetical protein
MTRRRQISIQHPQCGSILTVPVDECAQRASKLGWQVVFFDGVEEGDGRLIRLQLRHAPRTGGEVALEIRMLVWRQMMFNEVRQESYEIGAAAFLWHRRLSVSVQVPVLLKVP